jgi:predicted AlkP superfamily phosphohydrolase/phosphomutase
VIGKILAQVPEHVTVFIVSVDGMGPNYSGCHLLDQVLRTLGFTSILTNHEGKRPGSSDGNVAAAPRGQKDVMKRLRDTVPANLRRRISRYLPRQFQHRLSTRWMTADIDWSRTRAFCIPNANEGYIRVNLRGREPEGIVEPGAHYQQVCAELISQLEALVNPQTGRPAVREVLCVDDIFPGARRDDLADVIVLWDPETQITTEVYSETCGLLTSEQPGYALAPFYTGNHRPAAFFIARGPGFPPGQTVEGGHILDLAPTFLAHFDIALPEYMDGRLLSTLFARDPSR